MPSKILKSWLTERVNEINTAQTNVGLTPTTISIDEEYVLDNDGAIESVVGTLNAMKNNTYLKHSSLWNSKAYTSVAEGDIIKEDKKTAIEQLTKDISKICANYSYGKTGECSQTQVPTFTQDSTNASFSGQTQQAVFGQEQKSSFAQNSNNTTFSNNTNASSFSRNSNATSACTFNSANSSGFGQNFNATTFNAYTQGYSSNTCSAYKGSEYASFTYDGSNVGFAQNSGNTSGTGGNSFDSNNAAGFFQFGNDTSFSFNAQNQTFTYHTNNQTFTHNTSNHTFTFNEANRTSFAYNAANFSQNDNYSFMVKSDNTVISNSNTTPTGA